MGSTNLVEVTSPEHFKELLSADLNRVSVLNFWASWAEPCEEFNKVIEQESKGFEKVLFLNVSLHILTIQRKALTFRSKQRHWPISRNHSI